MQERLGTEVERGVRDSERERWRQREEEEDIDKRFSNGGKRTTSGTLGVANRYAKKI